MIVTGRCRNPKERKNHLLSNLYDCLFSVGNGSEDMVTLTTGVTLITSVSIMKRLQLI